MSFRATSQSHCKTTPAPIKQSWWCVYWHIWIVKSVWGQQKLGNSRANLFRDKWNYLHSLPYHQFLDVKSARFSIIKTRKTIKSISLLQQMTWQAKDPVLFYPRRWHSFWEILRPQHNKDPDSKVHGANMGPRQDPGGPHVCPMNFIIWWLSVYPNKY